jgi:hypothetical protein
MVQSADQLLDMLMWFVFFASSYLDEAGCSVSYGQQQGHVCLCVQFVVGASALLIEEECSMVPAAVWLPCGPVCVLVSCCS